MRKSYRFIHVVVILAFAGCLALSCNSDDSRVNSTEENTKVETESRLDLLIEWMSGHFNSSEQAKADTTYYDITMVMEPIWEDQTEAKYLYVEQSVTGSDQPYRQRVYKITDLGNDSFESAIYLIENDSLYIKAWDNMPIFDTTTFDHITLKEGCSVFLDYKEGKFEGSTIEGACLSNFRGATYATSEILITENTLSSWDRGFASDSTYIWGAEKGAYIFNRSSK